MQHDNKLKRLPSEVIAGKEQIYTENLLDIAMLLWRQIGDISLAQKTLKLKYNLQIGDVTVYPPPFLAEIPDPQKITIYSRGTHFHESALIQDAARYVYYNHGAAEDDLVIAKDLYAQPNDTIRKGLLYAMASSQIFPLIFIPIPKQIEATVQQIVRESTNEGTPQITDIKFVKQSFLHHIFFRDQYITSTLDLSKQGVQIWNKLFGRIEDSTFVTQYGEVLNELYPRTVALITDDVLQKLSDARMNLREAVKEFEVSIRASVITENELQEYVSRLHPNQPNVAWSLYTLMKQAEESGVSWIRVIGIFKSGDITQMYQLFQQIGSRLNRREYGIDHELKDGELLRSFLVSMREAFEKDGYIVRFSDLNARRLFEPTW